jgi:hypothetical protein
MAWYNPQIQGQGVAVAHPAFDTRRDALLVSPLPTVRNPAHTSTSTTRSKYRLRWRTLQLWDAFENQVNDYFTTSFSQADAAATVIHAIGYQTLFDAVNGQEARTEADIKALLLEFVMRVHNIIARWTNGAPLPSDSHASIVKIESGAGSYGLAGVCDFAMYNDDQARICLVAEAKNPWNVTPLKIQEVLNGKMLLGLALMRLGTAPVTGVHAGRLAVE